MALGAQAAVLGGASAMNSRRGQRFEQLCENRDQKS